MICPKCNGEKILRGIFPVYARDHEGPRRPVMELRCSTCKGTGEITEEQAGWIERGKAMREERKARGVGLREEAERRGMLPSALCDMEWGRVEPVFDNQT